MFEVTILGSGSAGNACLVCCGETRILIDAGLSARRLTERLTLCGVAVETLHAILLTHEHGDHTSAIKVLSKKLSIPIYANPLTAEALRFQNGFTCESWKLFATGSSFSIGDISVETFSVPHDAADPVGFVIKNRETRFAVLTDLGIATQSVMERIRGVDGILIETNYEEQLLDQDTKRPWSIKQRIASRHGHLSNSAAAELLAGAATERLKTVILGHLSRDCNSQERALSTMKNTLAALGFSEVHIHCAEQENTSPKFHVGAGRKNHTGIAALATI